MNSGIAFILGIIPKDKSSELSLFLVRPDTRIKASMPGMFSDFIACIPRWVR